VALLDASFTRSAPARTHLVSPLPALRDLPPQAARTAAAFRHAFGRPASAWSLMGYDAMQTVLDAIRRSGPKGNDRAFVARTLRDGRPRPTVLGITAIDSDGDPNPARWSEAFVRRGTPALGKPLG
jgi:ABC-type branched-subunit amino acid transport system substrate-binding protein